MKKQYTYLIIFTVSILIFTSCKEQYEPKTSIFEEVLVIESTITNELKKQTVKLSRVRRLESELPDTEKNATVVINANNETFTFTEIEAGTYQSNIAFKAVPDVEYILFITTENGKKYKSTPTFLTPEAPISNLYAQKETVNNQLGIQVYIDNNNTDNAKYFRYEFKETYKIITPYAVYHDLHIGELHYQIIDNTYTMVYPYYVTTTTEEKHICFLSEKQDVIIQTNLTNSSNNSVLKFPVQFISKEDSKIRSRYSILVKQYVQNFDSYNFYHVLKKFGSVGSLLSENQTGFVRGNIIAEEDVKEIVIGFFDVSNVSEKRIYFNYENFNLEEPKYPFECKTYTWSYDDHFSPDVDGDRNERRLLYHSFALLKPPYEVIGIQSMNGVPITFKVVNPECGNCATFASTIRPNFWID